MRPHRSWLGIPLMIFSYIGALRAWIYTPIFALLGASTVSIGLNTLTTGEVRQSPDIT
jgi:hypothetical protein